jgi:YhcH/YjgK/YiaL family protein
MIIDQLSNANLYEGINDRIAQAFDYLYNTDLAHLKPGKYAIDGDKIFAIVQEYTTLDRANEQMESHRKHIDVQYMISGSELVGHALLQDQVPSKEYDEQEDYMLFADAPAFFTKMDTETFMIFFPSDLHMPCIMDGAPAVVKKVVVKVKI